MERQVGDLIWVANSVDVIGFLTDIGVGRRAGLGSENCKWHLRFLGAFAASLRIVALHFLGAFAWLLW